MRLIKPLDPVMNDMPRRGTMKKRGFLFILVLIPVLVRSQSRVEAGDILRMIDKGDPVRFENVEIIGDLDFTRVEEITRDKRGDSGFGVSLGRRSNTIVIRRGERVSERRSRGSTTLYYCHVRSPIVFRRCVFLGNVLGYVHDDWENATYNAVFHDDVDFSGCEFREKSEFKYSRFLSDVDFQNTLFNEEALFKYTVFTTDVHFTRAKFHHDANFKYTNFPEEAFFDDALFRREANFKYTEFPEGVSFENAVFRRDAIFGYTDFSTPVNFEGAEFEDDVDVRYAKIDGRPFAVFLLDQKIDSDRSRRDRRR